MREYFNHRVQVAVGRWERNTFLRHWRRLYGSDKRWIPPYHPAFRWAMDPNRNSHLARLSPHFAYVEANVRDRNPSSSKEGQSAGASMQLEIPRATAVLLFDARQHSKTAYLSAFKCANDEQALARLVDHLATRMGQSGNVRLVGPTGLSPHIDSGVLIDHWDQTPPWHTVYNPPYLPELMDSVMRPLTQSRLYIFKVPEIKASLSATTAKLEPLAVEQLAGPLLTLFKNACFDPGVFSPLDSLEVQFLLRWLGLETLFGWLAVVNDQPAGFALLQPDLASTMRLTDGGRRPWWRLWLKIGLRWPVRSGRLHFGGVAPAWRGQGIGRHLLVHALNNARNLGWQTISVGPVADGSPAAQFLADHGGIARQSYRLYEFAV